MRLDRFASRYFFRPIIRLTPKNIINQKRIPILMYHSVSDEDEDYKHPYFCLNTKPDIFAKQMKYLKENAYKVINLSEVINYLNDHKVINENMVVITFDDGYKNFYQRAFPILKKLNFTATVFLPTKYINTKFRNEDCLTWEQIKYLHKEGMQFGSHTVTHPKLNELHTKEDVEIELKESKIMIEDKIGVKITDFSLPYAFPEENKEFIIFLRSLFRKFEYKSCVTTIIGTTQKDAYKLKRIPINSWDDLKLFRLKLEGAYDWLHLFQYMKKQFDRL